MQIAIVQPYIFPYVGYFQLIDAVDKFIFYDDVNFIKRGWINRNRILVDDRDYLFSIPCVKISQNKLILDTKVNWDESWVSTILKTLEGSYRKAPYFDRVYPLLCKVFGCSCENISELAQASILEVSNYLDINTIFCRSSECYQNRHLKKSARLIDICKQEGAESYINPIGGLEIYSKEEFLNHNIYLNFIKSENIEYKQFRTPFVPWLSIIDVMMFNSVEKIRIMLNQYKLI